MCKEYTAENYMEALLKTAILLGDLHRKLPVHQITISSFRQNDRAHPLPRCRIIVEMSAAGEDYLILFPERSRR